MKLGIIPMQMEMLILSTILMLPTMPTLTEARPASNNKSLGKSTETVDSMQTVETHNNAVSLQFPGLLAALHGATGQGVSSPSLKSILKQEARRSKRGVSLMGLDNVESAASALENIRHRHRQRGQRSDNSRRRRPEPADVEPEDVNLILQLIESRRK